MFVNCEVEIVSVISLIIIHRMQSDYFDFQFDEDDSSDSSELHTSYTEQNPSCVRSFVSPEATFSELHTAVCSTSSLLEPHSGSYRLTSKFY